MAPVSQLNYQLDQLAKKQYVLGLPKQSKTPYLLRPMTDTILIVDDESSILSSLKDILEDEGYAVSAASSAEDAITICENEDGNKFQAALVDIWMPGKDGLELLEWLQAEYPKLPVIIMSGHGTIETAVKATKMGAYDFIEKPLSIEKILITLKHALKEAALELENEELKRSLPVQDYEIVGESIEIKGVLDQIETAAPTDSWVLIKGENGTGKELVAQQIHKQSLRKNNPFVELNCAAIPEELIESELFGYEKGAFPGAINQKVGKFDKANGGTLFLDEIGDMSLKTQSKILRVLQEQRFERLGGTEVFKVDVRIIAATNKNLEKEIKKGTFREDLYFRLNVIPIEIPPLRERLDDIPLLVNYFLKQFNSFTTREEKEFTPEAMECMMQYHWPGNIRELRNIVERIVIMVKDQKIQPDQIPPSVRLRQTEVFQKDLSLPLEQVIRNFEKQFITSVLKKFKWNLSQAAQSIQIEKLTLNEKIKNLNIVVPNS